MYINANSKVELDEGPKIIVARDYKLINLDTNEEIKDCVWADDETGEYCIILRKENGNFIFDRDYDGKRGIRKVVRKGNIKFVKV